MALKGDKRIFTSSCISSANYQIRSCQRYSYSTGTIRAYTTFSWKLYNLQSKTPSAQTGATANKYVQPFLHPLAQAGVWKLFFLTFIARQSSSPWMRHADIIHDQIKNDRFTASKRTNNCEKTRRIASQNPRSSPPSIASVHNNMERWRSLTWHQRKSPAHISAVKDPTNTKVVNQVRPGHCSRNYLQPMPWTACSRWKCCGGNVCFALSGNAFLAFCAARGATKLLCLQAAYVSALVHPAGNSWRCSKYDVWPVGAATKLSILPIHHSFRCRRIQPADLSPPHWKSA